MTNIEIMKISLNFIQNFKFFYSYKKSLNFFLIIFVNKKMYSLEIRMMFFFLYSQFKN